MREKEREGEDVEWGDDSNTERQKLEVTAATVRVRIIIIIKDTTRHTAHIKHKRENNLNREPYKKSFSNACVGVYTHSEARVCVDVGGEGEQFMFFVFGSAFHDINVLRLR